MSRTDRWRVIEVKADGASAWSDRLDARQPAMKQWPFATIG